LFSGLAAGATSGAPDDRGGDMADELLGKALNDDAVGLQGEPVN
jgi:hypothetical protein